MDCIRMRNALCAAALALFAGAAAAGDVVRVAFIDVLSGPFALAGEGSLRQLREVVAQLNAKAGPGDPTIEIVPIDGKGQTQESLSALKSASDRGIRYITQGGGSGVAFALVDGIEKMAEREPAKSMVFLNYAAMDPGLTNDRCSFWHFRFYPSSEMIIEALTTQFKSRPDIKKVYLFNQNYAHGQQASKASRLDLGRKRPDVQIVGDDFIPIAQTKDFSPYVAKIAATGADTVITSTWGSDLTLFLKAAREFGLNINFFTLNANNPGTPSAMGSWGVDKVGLVWNFPHNAMPRDLEKISVDYKKKTGEDFIYGAHWNTMNMLLAAMRKAKSTDPVQVAYALEGLAVESPVGGAIQMRKTDHQLMAPLHLGMWAAKGSPGVKYDLENTGYGFRSEVIWDAYVSAQPTSCQMKRPAAPAARAP